MLKSRRKLFVITNACLLFVVACFAAVCFFPGGVIFANGYMPYYNGNRKSDKVSLMFNVYEGAEVVEGILSVLNNEEVKATFFVGGCFIDDNSELLNEIVKGGHEVGNHGYFHRNHAQLDEEGNLLEIENTAKVVKALCGVDTNLFAPPSGAYGQITMKVAQNAGYSVVLWSKDTIDWRDADAEKVYKRATEGVRGGDLVLMHPKKHTLKALPDIIKFYKNAGLKLCTVSENLFG